MKKIRFAIIGCGGIACDIGFVSRVNRKIQVVACVDSLRNKAETFAKKYRVPDVFTDYERLLKTCNLDVVYLAVPHYLHYPMIRQAVEKGLHVFCEKPVTVNLQEALDLCRRFGQLKHKIGVNYQYRYDKACYAIAMAAHKGELGEIYYIRCNVPWLRKDSYFTESTWHASKNQSGGGTLITQASHFIDIALWIANSRPENANGTSRSKKFKQIDVEDLFMGTIETENGCLIQLCSSMIAVPERFPTIEVYGSKGTALYEGRFFPKARFWNVAIKKERPPVGGLHALAGSLEAFRRWVTDELEYQMPIQNSLEVLAAVEALYQSAVLSKTVRVSKSYLEFV